MNRLISALFVCFMWVPALAQEPDSLIAGEQADSLQVADSENRAMRLRDSAAVNAVVHELDSLPVRELDPDHSPNRATMLALVLPGLGQIYNHKYWKIPIVWGALGGAGYAIAFNSNNYRDASLAYALDNTDINERALRYWRRNMELSYIALVAVYALQVLDAYVDALLYNWDVSENLSLRMTPSLQPMMNPQGHMAASYGFTCALKIKQK